MSVLIALTVAVLVQLAYWGAFQIGFERARAAERALRPGPATAPPPPASLIVAARNEASVLPRLLRAISHQDHPALDVVLVDDASSDDSAAILRHPPARVNVVRITDPVPPRKKHALTKGIAAAETDLLLFTDADCIPKPGWASRIAQYHRSTDNVVVLGYSPFERTGGFLNGFARYETFLTGFTAAATVGLGQPYTAVGRNISYTRSLFDDHGGFDHSLDLLSGDDDLLVQHLLKGGRAHFVHAFGSDTYVPTDTPTTWREWARQKLRHVSTGSAYRTSIKLHLLAYHVTATATWLAPLFVGWWGLGFVAIRLIYVSRVLSTAAKEFGERDLLVALPLWEFGYAVYNATLAVVGSLRRPKRW